MGAALLWEADPANGGTHPYHCVASGVIRTAM